VQSTKEAHKKPAVQVNAYRKNHTQGRTRIATHNSENEETDGQTGETGGDITNKGGRIEQKWADKRRYTQNALTPKVNLTTV